MPDEIKVLIVEDEDDQVEIYKDAITEHNEVERNLNIEVSYAKTYEDAMKYIEEQVYDSAFIDLCLDKNSMDEKRGKELISYIKTHAKYPIYIVSGSLDDDTAKLAENKFISEYERGSQDVSLDLLLDEVEALYKTGITRVLNAEGFFAKHLHEIFWKHFSQSKDYWLENHLLDGTELEKSISRYALSHLYEYLEISEQGNTVKYDVSEMYIYPIIKQKISPGDVVTLNNEYQLVMTPACDLAQQTNNIIFVKLNKFLSLSDIIDKRDKYKTALDALQKESSEDTIKNEAKNKEAVKNLLRNYISNNKGNRYHFLPNFLEFEAHTVDFQLITTISLEAANELPRLLSITPAHFKDIQARFASYYARQGSPDFEYGDLSSFYLEGLISPEE